jgi:hypothetical protein
MKVKPRRIWRKKRISRHCYGASQNKRTLSKYFSGGGFVTAADDNQKVGLLDKAGKVVIPFGMVNFKGGGSMAVCAPGQLHHMSKSSLS